MVVGLEDEEYGQRVAAAVTLRDPVSLLWKRARTVLANNFQAMHLTIEKLREDLRLRLAGYKLPTVLRIVQSFPKSASGKVVKKILRGEIFPKGGHCDIQWYTMRKSRL